MEQNVLNEVIDLRLLEEGDRVLVGVSGGPDSMALLHWLWNQRHRWGLQITAVHVNHQLRGEEANQDEEFVYKQCLAWEIPCFLERVDVKRYADEEQLSKQVAARECRYQVYKKLAEKYNITKLALAHHGEDQIETVIMRLMRGAGLGGLSGISPKRQDESYTIIRPFMSLSKQEIEEYCSLNQIPYRIDQSNLEDDYTRNWVRHHVMPLLLKANPNLPQVLYESTSILREEDQYLEKVAMEYVKQVIESQSLNKIAINLSFFKEVPLPLQRRVILLILNYLHIKRSSWSKVHIDQILELIQTNKGHKELDLPYQVLVVREYQRLYIMKKDWESTNVHKDVEYEYHLHGVNEYHFTKPLLHLLIVEGEVSLEEEKKWRSNYRQVDVATFDTSALCFPLILRNRRKGDCFQPLGMNGHKKVKDIFIDQKIPLPQRQGWPILTDSKGIIWIPGLKKGNRGKVTKDTTDIITILIGRD